MVFEHLDAPQLIKHILGLKTQYGKKDFTLIYLWYDFASTEAEKHRQEIQAFKNSIENEIDLRYMTYQNLFEAVSSIPGIDNGYISYIHDRYFLRRSPAMTQRKAGSRLWRLRPDSSEMARRQHF